TRASNLAFSAPAGLPAASGKFKSVRSRSNFASSAGTEPGLGSPGLSCAYAPGRKGPRTKYLGHSCASGHGGWPLLGGTACMGFREVLAVCAVRRGKGESPEVAGLVNATFESFANTLRFE